MKEKINRRSFLRGVGASVVFGSGVAAADDQSENSTQTKSSGSPAGTAAVDNDKQLPIYAKGRSIHKYRSNGDTYTYTHKFTSSDLNERYDNPVIEFEPETIPKEWLSDDIKKRKASTISVADKLVIGTAKEHNNAEKRIHQIQRASSGDVTTQTHLTDEIPLYHYKSSSDARDKQARKAPINIGWEDIGSAGSVKSFLEGTCNWTQYDWLPEEPRYINDDGTVKSTAEHVMDRIQFTKQWHVRLYNIGHDTYDVIGQAHRDPLNHNQGIKVDNWHFDDAREEIVGCWIDNSSRYPARSSLNNGSDWESHNGNIAMLRTQ
ncbi:hypothetical protein ACOZ4B_19585 [Haloferax prahovense]|uniref:hypothetical protein n=1 Tax=Haloferax TaxID=2251 RepID=UPI00209C2025|nr:hypothetical protein [Haloferax sp. AB510]MCO8267083.1 hypothetical protein [Haloferax sp. AB510]